MSFWKGFYKEASSLAEKRKTLALVRPALEPHGDFICVLEGASITRTTKPGIIKQLRETLMNYERSVGEDPTHDWSKK